MYKLVILSLFLLNVGCEKENQFGYPAGIRVSDMETENDCSLDECSNERVRRLIAHNVEGTILIGTQSDTLVHAMSYSFSHDTYLVFYICDLPQEFQVDGLKVKFSGDLHDACGFRDYGGLLFEEVYLLKLIKIKKS